MLSLPESSSTFTRHRDKERALRGRPVPGENNSPEYNAVLDLPNCLTRGTPVRKWLRDYDSHKALGAVLPKAPRTPRDGST